MALECEMTNQASWVPCVVVISWDKATQHRSVCVTTLIITDNGLRRVMSFGQQSVFCHIYMSVKITLSSIHSLSQCCVINTLMWWHLSLEQVVWANTHMEGELVFWGEDASTADRGRGAAVRFTLYVPLAHSFASLSAMASTSLATCGEDTSFMQHITTVTVTIRKAIHVYCSISQAVGITLMFYIDDTPDRPRWQPRSAHTHTHTQSRGAHLAELRHDCGLSSIQGLQVGSNVGDPLVVESRKLLVQLLQHKTLVSQLSTTKTILPTDPLKNNEDNLSHICGASPEGFYLFSSYHHWDSWW